MAANPMRGEAELTAGGETYKLALDVNAFCLLQPMIDMKPIAIVSAFENDPDDFVLMRGLLWAALQKNHECHLVQAGEIMGEAGFVETRTVLANLLASFFNTGPKEGGESARPQKKTRATG